jgi:hypothetical protein
MGVFQILSLVLTFGPKIIALAWKVYKLIEDYSHKKENDGASDVYDGVKPSSEDKAQRFDILLKVQAKDRLGKDLDYKTIATIREKMHQIRQSKKRGEAK